MTAALQLLPTSGETPELSQKARPGKKMPGQLLDWGKSAVNDGMHWGKSKVKLRLVSAQLIATNDDGNITNYLVDKNRDYGQVLKELDASNTATVSYLYGDDLIKQTRSANDSYYIYDGHGSTRALADSAGAITDTYDYNAYGTLIDSTGSIENDYKYAGEQFDSNLNNYYLRARYYDQSVGRFTTMDTFQGFSQDPVTLHKYLYANADPANMLDPSGQFSIGSVMAAIGNAARLATTATVNIGRSFASRVNGQKIGKVVTSIKVRIWLTRTVGKVQSKLPQHIFGKGKVSKNGKGWRWGDAKNNVRVQKGNPNAGHASQRVDYVQIRSEGKGIVGRDGKALSSKFTDKAHIPLTEWRTWARWDSPL